MGKLLSYMDFHGLTRYWSQMATSSFFAPLVERHAQRTPDRVLATDGAREWTYNRINTDATALAAALGDLGVSAGDRIGVHLPNTVEWVIAVVAAERLGAVIVPISPQLSMHDLRYQLRHAEVSTVVTIERWNGVDYLQRFEDLLSDLPDLQYVVTVGEEDLWYDDRIFQLRELIARGTGKSLSFAALEAEGDAALMYTSGTMGKPKAVQLSHQALVGNAVGTAQTLSVRTDDRVLALISFSSIFGLTAMIGTLASGATLVLLPSFDAGATVSLIASARVSILLGVPSQFHLIMREPSFNLDRVASLRTGLLAGAAAGEELLRRIRRWCDVLVGYGLTETAGAVTITRFDDSEDRRMHSVGCPMTGIEVMAMDVLSGDLHGPEAVGEIAVRGIGVMTGYLRMPSETANVMTPEGFFLTGDIGIIDEDGCVRILGRRQESISRAGQLLYPREIEDRLRTHPAVDDVCVIGVPHDVMGELVCACIVAVEGAVITGDEIKRFARDTMAATKIPDLVRFFDSFPLTGSGKVRRRELARAIALSTSGLSASALGVQSPNAATRHANALDHPVSYQG